MNWFFFIIYFQLFASLRIVCIISGIVEIGIAVASILCRKKLAGFQKGGPQFYWGLMTVNIVLSLFMLISFSAIMGQPVIDTSTVTQLVVGAVMLGVNIVYFRKRMHLFVN